MAVGRRPPWQQTPFVGRLDRNTFDNLALFHRLQRIVGHAPAG
jgi:hypothetical protein